MSNRMVALLFIGLVGIVAACGSDDITAPSGEADFRVVNASLTVESFDLRVDDVVIAENITFGPGECVVVASGARTVTLSANGGELISIDGNVLAGFEYALMLWGDAEGEPAVATLVTDVQTPVAGINGLRFINISGAAGDVFLTEPASDPSGDPALSQLSNEAVTPFLAAPVEQSMVSLFPVGERTDPIASIALPPLAGRIGTVVFVGAGAPGDQTALVFERCPAP